MSEKKTTRKRRKKKKGIIDKAKQFSRFEMLFIVVLFLGFFAWAFNKCSEKRPVQPNTATAENTESQEDTETDISPAAANNPNSPSYEMDEIPAAPATPPSNTSAVPPNNTTNTPRVAPSKRSYTPLYVTLQDLKVRQEPSLNAPIVSILNLNEEVMFMEKRTDFREKINIGNGEITNEPWIYIRTRKGHVGWVYGAGIHYFKWDRLRDPIPSISAEEE